MTTTSIQQEGGRLNLSTLMSSYNYAVHSGKFERGRVNRALGIVMSGRIALLPDGNAIAEGNGDTYYITREGCDCPDHTWRRQTCKHQIARFLILKSVLLAKQTEERMVVA